MMVQLTLENFDAEVTKVETPVIVLWGNSGNVASNLIAFRLQRQSIQAKLCRVEVDQQAQLAMKFSLRQLPFLMLFVNGLTVVASADLDTFMKGAKEWIVS